MAGANREATRLNESKFSYTTDETIEAAAKMFVGEMVERVDSTGEVRPATAVSGVLVLGVGTKEVDNTDDGETVNFISTAIHEMDQDGSITRSSIGDVCYVVDAATCSVSAVGAPTTNIAGRIVEVPGTTTVFVDFDPAVKG